MQTSTIADEADLIRRLKARDPQALAEIFDRYGSLMQAVILRIVRDSAAAEDVMQESFLAVWSRIGTFDPRRGAFPIWITLIARCRALDYCRSRERFRRQGVPLAEVEHYLRASSQPLAVLELAHLLRQPWSELKRHEREVLRLTHWAGLSQQEIALMLHRPLGTIKTWIRRSHQALREALDGAQA